ncbi:tyrosine-type recombinase/integrase [Cribrihabitans pelagius]|uniref:tyrosine-type recombinase/integrase n=1 Tax=Cribrihabitans pelagius TaxID=1765746 RepID=UPI003B5C2BF5
MDLSKLDAHPANNRLKCWRALFKWLHGRGMIDVDPAAHVLPRKAPKSEGHTAWTRADLETFRDHWPHDTPQRLCMKLLYRSCAAMVDACRIGPGMVKGGWLTMQRSKSLSLAVIPWTAETAPDWFEWTGDLDKCLEAAPRHRTYIITASGKPRSEKAASQWFSKACRAAGLGEGKSAHGLRKLRASMLRENGATEDQRKAILGHETGAEAEHYSKSADLRRVISGTEFPTPPNQVPTFRGK